MYGSFSEKAQEAWDFVRCQRADGSFYGSPSKTCKKGKPVGDGVGEEPKEKETKPKSTQATSVEKEEAKLAKLEQRLAAAEEKVSRARGGVTTARARSGTKLMTSAGRRAGSAADRAITREQELSKQVREQRAKVNEMKGIKPKVETPAPRTAKDDRRDKLRKTIDSINERAKRLKASKGSDSPEFKRFVKKYGDKLTKLQDEQRKLMIEV